MEATALVPLGMGLIVVGAGLGIGRFAAAARMAENIVNIDNLINKK